MKILTTLILIMLMTAFVVPMILAEEADADVSDSEDSVIAIADSSSLSAEETELEMNEEVSAGKVAWKQLQLWFTFKQEKKVEGELGLARLRLIQAKVAAKNGNNEAMEKALEAHERIMNRVQERVKTIEIATDGKNVEAPVAKLVALETAIAVHERRIAFLNKVLENAELTEEQRERIEARIQHVEEVTNKLQELNEAKKEKLVTKLMAVGDMTEEEANALVDAKEATIREKARERIALRLADKSGETEENQEENQEQNQGNQNSGE